MSKSCIAGRKLTALGHDVCFACTAGQYNLAQEEYWDRKSLRVAGLRQPPEAISLEFCVSIVSVRLPMHRS